MHDLRNNVNFILIKICYISKKKKNNSVIFCNQGELTT